VIQAGPEYRKLARTQLVLADDHRLTRVTFRYLLSLEADLEVVAEATDGVEALHLALEKRPQVLLLDLVMPSLNGLEVAQAVRRQLPETKIAVVTIYIEAPYVDQALRSGANAFIDTSRVVDDLVPGIRTMLAGGRFLSVSAQPSRPLQH